MRFFKKIEENKKEMVFRLLGGLSGLSIIFGFADFYNRVVTEISYFLIIFGVVGLVAYSMEEGEDIF